MSGFSDDDLVEAYREGLTLEEVGERFDLTYKVVRYRIYKAAPWILRPKGLPPRAEPNRAGP